MLVVLTKHVDCISGNFGSTKAFILVRKVVGKSNAVTQGLKSTQTQNPARMKGKSKHHFLWQIERNGEVEISGQKVEFLGPQKKSVDFLKIRNVCPASCTRRV